MYFFTSIYTLAVLLFPSCGMAMQKPPPLVSGDAIRIIATGGAVNPSALTNGTTVLRDIYGLQIRQHPSVLDADLYYAGTDEVRARSVIEAVHEDGVKAIWAARGGYGTTRIIESTQDNVINSLRGYPRWLVGYSDLTALHALWNRAGMLSLHGPMGSDVQFFSDAARENMFGILAHQVSELTFSGTVRRRGKGNVNGKFLGGNLSVLAGMVGSGFLPSYQGAILFIEDTGEVDYRLDRLLTTLLRSEDFSGIVGIAIGQLLDGDTDDYTALELLDRTLAPLGLPVITGLPIGHDTATAMPVVVGADAEIDVEAGSLVISF
ncbi:peptidase family S66 [Armillaria novae-zelandiae]|uniref:Peptidase family S66 n=1 Tax=Armillaria novae-zelandiae TaxID=153914 RepID=A0AA39PND4_9AGAR|nr:peptidase family S66 [Armillaria novae-zelandiae]